MRRTHMFPLAIFAMAAQAQSLVYVTDLPLFTRLAPCAASAVEDAVMSMTRAACPEAVADLQGCVCTRNNNLAAISSALSRSVSYSCGSTASQDQASATTVLSAYCNQATPVEFPQPSVLVSQYITDVAEYHHLAPCAKSGLSYAVQSMTRDLCHSDATALATCACQKNQNSLKISQVINSSVRYYCDSHLPDVTSAQAMFSAYCNMNLGTSAFPVPSPPPGDMTYFITALPAYSALAPCAMSAVSYAMSAQTRDYCPEGPQAVASCVCLKESMFGLVSSLITSSVKYSCSSTATEDITSALNLFSYYCSAAQNLVKATGVAESIAQTYPAAKTGTVGASGGSFSGGASETGGGSSSGSGSGSGNSGGGSGSGGSGSGGGTQEEQKGPSVGLIAGAAAGGVAILLIIALAAFFVMRNKRRKQAAANSASAIALQSQPGGYPGPGEKAELGGTPIVGVAAHPPVSPSPSTLKPNGSALGSPRTDNVSPISAHHNSAFAAPPLPNKPELGNPTLPPPPSSLSSPYGPPPPQGGYPGPYGHQHPPPPPQQQQQQYWPPAMPYAHLSEMQGGQTYSTMIRPEMPDTQIHGAPPQAYGMMSYNQGPQQLYEIEGRGSATVPPHAEMPGMSWHSGPVAGYSELDGRGRGGGHPR